MQNVAQSWLVLQLTGSALLLGLLGTLQFGPILLFSLLAGAVADRVPRRPLLITTQALLGGQALLLGVLTFTGRVQYWHVAVLGFVVGLAQTIDGPARQALVTGLVGRSDVSSAIALNSASFNGARIVGPAVAGLLIGQFGVPPVFFINSLGFLVVILTLLRTPEPPRSPRSAASLGQEIAEGLRYAAGSRLVRLILGILLVVSLCVFNFSVYVPLLARTVLHLGPEGFGFLLTALGVGAVTGAVVLGTRGGAGPRPALLGGAAGVACLGLLGLGLARSVWAAVPLLFVTGCAGTVTLAGCNTALQVDAPEHLRGRVMSLYTFVYGGVFPFSSFLAGATAERWGISVTLRLAGLVGLGILAAVAAWAVSASRPGPRSPAAARPG